jgi:hypothetical protein
MMKFLIPTHLYSEGNKRTYRWEVETGGLQVMHLPELKNEELKKEAR